MNEKTIYKSSKTGEFVSKEYAKKHPDTTYKSSTRDATPLYEGTKRIYARPMTRGDYNKYRGWEMPADENAKENGYLVEYTNGDKSNHKNHKGYISWSPANVFEDTYKKLKSGSTEKVATKSNDSVTLSPPSSFMERLVLEQKLLQTKAEKLEENLKYLKSKTFY